MKITETHVQFWQAKRRPSWAPAPARVPSVHACIAAHAGPEPSALMSRHFAASNTLALVRMKTQRGLSLREALADLCKDVPAAPRRAADIRKWARRLDSGFVLTVHDAPA